jgi:ADP-ribose pyrophosphatase YjhB (NUDIX family)
MCGGDLEPRSLRPHEPERLVCVRCGFIFYLDPKVAVGTIIRDERNHLLFLRRAIEPGYGRWVFPGGYVDRGEEVHVAALREAREEAGLEIRLDYLINVYSYPGRAPVIIVYAATVVSGDLLWDDESLEGRFFAPEEIPWDELAFRSTYQALREYLGGGPDGPPQRALLQR